MLRDPIGVELFRVAKTELVSMSPPLTTATVLWQRNLGEDPAA